MAIVGDASRFLRELRKAESATHKFGRAAAVAGAAIATGIAVGLEESVRAAIKAETSTARLDQAFKNAHLSARKYSQGLDAAEAAGRRLGFTDNDVRDSLGSLITATHNYGKAVTDLGVAQDLARFKHTSLEAATKMLTAAMAGNVRAAKQLGIIIPSSITDPQQKAAAVIDAVTQRVHGQAAAFSDTAQGGMAQFHAQTEHIEEVLGKALLPAITTVVDGLAHLIDRLSGSRQAQDVAGKAGQLLSQVLNVVKDTVANVSHIVEEHRATFEKLANFYSAVFVPLLRFVFVQVLPIAIDVAVRAIGVVVRAIDGIVTAGQAMAHGISGSFGALRDAVNGVSGFIARKVDDIVGFWAALPGRVADAVKGKAQELWNGVKHIFDKLPGFIKDALGIHSPSRVFMEIGEAIIHGAIKGIENKAGSLLGAAQSAFGALGAVGSAVGGLIHGGGAPNNKQNQNIAQNMMQGYGMPLSQWPYLQALWQRESGWSQYAYNASSGATGIPQALPYTKMPRAAWLPSQGGQADPAAQIGWGLGYIKGRYHGSPLEAWQHETAFGWYDKGGYLPTGLSLALNTTGRPEPVGHHLAGGTTVNVNVAGSVVTERELVDTIRREFIRTQNRNGGTLFTRS